MNLNGELLAASGTATINPFGFVNGTVSFAFKQQTVDVNLNGGTVPLTSAAWGAGARGPPGPDIQGATLTTLGLTVPVGQSLTIGAGGVNFSVTNATLGLAVITPAASDTNDSRQWVTIKGSIANASFSGIPGVTLSVSNVAIDVNQFSGAYSGVATQALNWATQVGTFTGSAFTPSAVSISVPAPTGAVQVNFTDTTGGFALSGNATVNLFDVVSGTVGFSFSAQDVTSVALGNGQGTLASGTLTTLTLTASNLFVGGGGIGFQISSGSVTIARLASKATGDTRTWTALSTSLVGGFVGIPGVTLDVSSLQVMLNQAAGTNGATAAAPLDWHTANLLPAVAVLRRRHPRRLRLRAHQPLRPRLRRRRLLALDADRHERQRRRRPGPRERHADRDRLQRQRLLPRRRRHRLPHERHRRDREPQADRRRRPQLARGLLDARPAQTSSGSAAS